MSLMKPMVNRAPAPAADAADRALWPHRRRRHAAVCLATGGICSASGLGSVLNFPSTTAKPPSPMAVGGVLMFWAAARAFCARSAKQPHMLRQDDDIA